MDTFKTSFAGFSGVEKQNAKNVVQAPVRWQRGRCTLNFSTDIKGCGQDRRLILWRFAEAMEQLGGDMT